MPTGIYQRELPELRFWKRVNKYGPVSQYRPDLGSCWIWTGAKSAGYGHMRIDGKCVLSHRFSYSLLVSDALNGKELDHLCRVAACVNPSHLEPVTHKTNMMRGFGPGGLNHRKTHCLKGHELSGDNLYFKNALNKNGTRSQTRKCRECDNSYKKSYNEIRKSRYHSNKALTVRHAEDTIGQ